MTALNEHQNPEHQSVETLLGHLNRSAHASIRGYLTQLLYTAELWMDLADNEVLVIEGREDIDRFIIGEDRCVKPLNETQLKDLGKSINIRSESVWTTLFNFIVSYRFHCTQGNSVKFVMAATSELKKQRIASETRIRETDSGAVLDLEIEVIPQWYGISGLSGDAQIQSTGKLAQAVNKLFEYHLKVLLTDNDAEMTAASKHANEVSESLQWMNEQGAWLDFFLSVSWQFNLENTEQTFHTLTEKIANRHDIHDLPASDLARAFLYHVLQSATKERAMLRCLDVPLRNQIISNSDEELKIWAKRTGLVHLENWQLSFSGEIQEHGKRIRQLEESVIPLLPDIEADNKCISQFTSAARKRIRFDIHGYTLPRTLALQALGEALKDCNTVVLRGASGAGKSALVRKYTESLEAVGGITLWIGGSYLECQDLHSLSKDIGIQMPLERVLSNCTGKVTVVLDGISRVHNLRFYELFRELIEVLAFDDENLSCQFIMTCQTADWEWIEDNLKEHRLTSNGLRAVECPAPDKKELSALLNVIPSIRHILDDPRLEAICQNLKILDLIAFKAMNGGEVSADELLSENRVASWFWDKRVNSGIHSLGRSRVLMKMGEALADTLTASVSLNDSIFSDSAGLQSLQGDSLIETEACQRVVFAHDLFGDWARLHILKAEPNRAGDYLCSKVSSPLWHRAVRLYGADLLEKHGRLLEWNTLFKQLSESSGDHVADLLLESLFFSSNASFHLALASEALLNDDGALLKRMLTRFLAFATQVRSVPAPTGRFAEGHTASNRLPINVWWPPVLTFIYEQREQVVKQAPLLIAQITAMWLKATSKDDVMRREMSELALMLGCYATAHYRSCRPLSSEIKKSLYSTALMAATELPEKTVTLGLFLAERNTEPREDRHYAICYPLSSDRAELNPLEEGPVNEVDDAFIEVVTHTNALLPLIRSAPSGAAEILLACIYVSEQEKLRRNGRRDEWHYDINKFSHSITPYWEKFSFYAFLQLNFDNGLSVITRLINTLSQRWVVRREEDQHSSHNFKMYGMSPSRTLTVVLFGESKMLAGDGRVLGWSSGLGDPLPESVMTSALMAIEKFLYDSLQTVSADAFKSLLRKLWSETQSTPLLQVIINVGKIQPSLFTGELMPLLGLPALFDWDNRVMAQNKRFLNFADGYLNYGQTSALKAFNQLSHRELSLRNIALFYYLENNDVHKYLNYVKTLWQQALLEMPEGQEKDELAVTLRSFNAPDYERMINAKGSIIWERKAITSGREFTEEENALLGIRELCSVTATWHGFLKKGHTLEISLLDTLAESLQSKFEPLWREECDRNYDVGDGSSLFISASADALANGIAVVLYCRQPSCEPDIALVNWCRKTLRDLIFSPPPADPEEQNDFMELYWEGAASLAVLTLWKNTPHDPELRELVVQMAFSVQDAAAGRLLGATGTLPVELYDDVLRLRRLVFDSAWLRARYRRWKLAERMNLKLESDDIEREFDQLAEWISSLSKAFIEGTSPPPSSRWCEMDTSAFFDIYDNEPMISSRYKGIDFERIWEAHAPLYGHQITSPAHDKGYRVAFLENALGSRVEIMRHLTDMQAKGASYLQKVDIMLLNQLASFSFTHGAIQLSESVWTMLLSLPMACERWIETYLHFMFEHGLIHSTQPRMLPDIIAKYRHSLDELSDEQKQGYGSEFWQSLVGIHPSVRFLWKQNSNIVALRMWEFIEQHCKGEQTDAEYLVAVCGWLCTPAAFSLRVNGLDVLVNLPSMLDKANGFQRRHLAMDLMADFLTRVWNDFSETVINKSESKTNFIALLSWLADAQHRAGLQLTGKIGNL
ncbi:P-loop NTPase family protein [[Curtobacterium] plantarum]|uniref:hypothetical protein n=1 Tax=[Curtobacterium] plantarum TaxID=221276 RepID=UPI0021D78CE6|nr:hypothetical protein [[Curtobacterium] plantarum]